MNTKLVTAPAALPVPLAAAITAARADGAGMDAEIEMDVRGIAGEVEHALGRALVEQTWLATLDAFPSTIRLTQAAPLIEVEHVRYLDANGQQHTLAPERYVVDAMSEPARILPAPGHSWPSTARQVNAVEVQYRCGYGDDHTAVPAEIKSYILGRVAAKYAPGDNRNAAFLDGLLDRHKVY